MVTLPSGLIVSCQAYAGEPLFGSAIMAAMARAAKEGGAVAIRANSPPDIAAIRAVTKLPIIGLYKLYSHTSEVYITPTRASASAIARAGCDIVAIDATPRPRDGGETLARLIPFIQAELDKSVLADCACLDDALAAVDLGVDFVGTTMAGYTTHGRALTEGPDLDFVRELVARVHTPVIAEGRFYTPEQAAQALALGAHAVCVGGAITRPQDTTRRFIKAMTDVKTIKG